MSEVHFHSTLCSYGASFLQCNFKGLINYPLECLSQELEIEKAVSDYVGDA